MSLRLTLARRWAALIEGFSDWMIVRSIRALRRVKTIEDRERPAAHTKSPASPGLPAGGGGSSPRSSLTSAGEAVARRPGPLSKG